LILLQKHHQNNKKATQSICLGWLFNPRTARISSRSDFICQRQISSVKDGFHCYCAPCLVATKNLLNAISRVLLPPPKVVPLPLGGRLFIVLPLGWLARGGFRILAKQMSKKCFSFCRREAFKTRFCPRMTKNQGKIKKKTDKSYIFVDFFIDI
jgi:hypothetical protein